MKKKVLVVLLVLILMALSAPLVQAAIIPPSVVLNGDRLVFSTEPVLVESRWLVPLRGIFAPLGFSLEYDPVNQMIFADRGTTHIEMQIGNKNVIQNGENVTLDVPPQAVNGSTMVPLRFIAESLKAKVEYRKDSNSVTISLKENQDLSTGIYDAYTFEGWDDGTSSPINPTTVFSSQAEKAYAYVVLDDILSGEITANWYFLGNGSREFVTTYTLNEPGYYSYYFWIANSVFRTGDWECEIVLNGQPATNLFFEIVDDSSSYKTISYWDTWTYEGYVENGKPHGAGVLTSATGTTVSGYFEERSGNLYVSQGDMLLTDGDEVFGDFIFYANGDEHYEGTYYYVSGTIFEGIWDLNIDGTSPEMGTYYYTDGTSKVTDTY